MTVSDSLRCRVACVPLMLIACGLHASEQVPESMEETLSPAVTLASVYDKEPDPGRGSELYAVCEACHQASGWGVRDGSVPHIAGQHYSYLAGQLIEFRMQHRGDTRMQHFLADQRFANPQAIADVAAYVSMLTPSPMPAAANTRPDERGKLLFEQICQQCHNKYGEGNATLAVPRIAGQYPSYIARRVRTIIQQDEHYSNALVPMLLDELSDAEIEAVAHYVSGLGKAVPAQSR